MDKNMFFSEDTGKTILSLDKVIQVYQTQDEDTDDFIIKAVIDSTTEENNEAWLWYESELSRNKDFDRLTQQLKGETNVRY